jgi:hypothetical protein
MQKVRFIRYRLSVTTLRSSLLQAFLPAPEPPIKSDAKNDPCFGWGAYGSSHELVHYKHVAAAAASLLKDSFDK